MTEMASNDDGIPLWRRWLLPTVMVFAFALPVVWVWRTARGSTDGFPAALIQAEGLLLTALVFVMGFGQSSLRRAADRAVADIQTWAENLRTVYGNPAAVSTTDLFTICHEAEASTFGVSVLIGDVQRDPSAARRRYRRFSGDWTEGNLDEVVSVVAIDRELERQPGEAGAPTARRRRYLERERARLHAERTQRFERAEDLGQRGGARLKAIGGKFTVELALALWQLRAVRVFAAAMVALTVLGAVYDGWSSAQAPPPELWAALVIPALAFAYAWILTLDARSETSRVKQAIVSSWPCVLDRAEGVLNMLYDESRSESAEHDVRVYLDQILDPLQDSLGDFGWYLSVRARQIAHSPLRKLGEHPGSLLWEADRRRLARARRYAHAAAERADDPVAAVTLAALLEIDDFGRYREGDRPVELIDRAVALMTADEAPSPSNRFLDGYGLAAMRLSEQALLHPLDERLAERLRSALDDEHPDPAKLAIDERIEAQSRAYEALSARVDRETSAWQQDEEDTPI
ncbi:hypothetical protein KV097_07295 [Mumia sp. zg.B17]|uniref:hypothetical protein n=1 Tax=Mumia sp. zg.B17 TaxID=2855446 RepID=UPI001C6F2B66|nr:hypothetical protein [Mumia sp. zg.B17]MBW9205748.1 hypothetical protein [Mumia sp. zg.B17]